MVVTHNGEEWLERCLISLQESICSVKVIVVDNSSTDSTVEIVRRFPQVEFIQYSGNTGFGSANNVVLRRAVGEGADFAFLLNQDAVVEPDTVEHLVMCAFQNPQYGVLSPIHLSGSGSEIDPNFAYYIATGAPKFYSDLFVKKRIQDVYPIRFANAAAWLVTRRCLLQVGGFDPIFHMYEEDADYCQRVWHHRLQVGLVPTARILHFRESARPQYKSNWHRRYSNLRTMSRRVKTNGILMLKNPSQPFLQQAGLTLVELARDFLQALLRFHFHYAVVVTIGTIDLIASLPAVWQHRSMDMVPGPNWLSTGSHLYYRWLETDSLQ